MDESFLQVRAILVDNFACDAERLTPESRLREDLQLDEVEILELTAAIEDETRVAISNDASGTFQTVGDISEYIKQETTR